MLRICSNKAYIIVPLFLLDIYCVTVGIIKVAIVLRSSFPTSFIDESCYIT